MTLKEAVSTYIMSSYMYYVHDKSCISDNEYDMICKRILDNYDNTGHSLSWILSKGELACGSGYRVCYRLPHHYMQYAIYWHRTLTGEWY